MTEEEKKFTDEEVFLKICEIVKYKFMIPKENDEIIKITGLPEQSYMIKVQNLKYWAYGKELTLVFSLYEKESRCDEDITGSGTFKTTLEDMLYYLKNKPMIFNNFEEAKLVFDLMG